MTEAVVGETPRPAAADTPVVSTRYRTYALVLLMLINAVNILDRMVITNLIEPIKEDLNLTDGQVGAMAGFYFAVVYTLLGIPLARWADRGDRPRILALALAVWSGFSLLGGFAQNFALLVASRMGVAVGEAGCSPTAHSLLTEYTPREKRAMGLSVYSMGGPIGAMAGMAMGAVVAESYGARTAFLVAGMPGLVLAVFAIFTLKEPRRALKAAGAAAAHAAEHVPFRAAMRVLSRKPTFWFFAIGAALYAVVAYAHSHFLASYFVRNYTPELTELAAGFGMQPRGFLGTALGVISGVGGIVGALIGGWFADRFGARDLRWYGVLPAVFPLLSTPILWWAFLTPNLPLALLLLIVPTIGHALWYGPVYGGVRARAARLARHGGGRAAVRDEHDRPGRRPDAVRHRQRHDDEPPADRSRPERLHLPRSRGRGGQAVCGRRRPRHPSDHAVVHRPDDPAHDLLLAQPPDDPSRHGKLSSRAPGAGCGRRPVSAEPVCAKRHCSRRGPVPISRASGAAVGRRETGTVKLLLALAVLAGSLSLLASDWSASGLAYL